MLGPKVFGGSEREAVSKSESGHEGKTEIVVETIIKIDDGKAFLDDEERGRDAQTRPLGGKEGIEASITVEEKA
jgi:hypothetical protein